VTVIPLRPRTEDSARPAGKAPFLRTEDRLLTARQVVGALASYLAEFGDNFHGEVDPLHAIDAQVRYGDLDGWQQDCTPQHRATLLARAEQIARDHFGHTFPVVTW
jgi:hypothetical protein